MVSHHSAQQTGNYRYPLCWLQTSVSSWLYFRLLYTLDCSTGEKKCAEQTSSPVRLRVERFAFNKYFSDRLSCLESQSVKRPLEFLNLSCVRVDFYLTPVYTSGSRESCDLNSTSSQRISKSSGFTSKLQIIAEVLCRMYN